MLSPVSISHQGITFTVEPATELLGVISVLCMDQDAICDAGMERCNRQYREDILSFFAPFRGAPVTKWLERFSDQYNFNYDVPVALFLHLLHQMPIDREELFRFRKPIPPDEFEAFLHAVHLFRQKSRFDDFYQAHRPLYETVIRHFIADDDLFHPLAFLQNDLKVPADSSFYINLMLAVTNSNYSAALGNRLYTNVCPNHRSRYAPLPDFSYQPIYWTTLIVHEFAHPFINPLTRQYSSVIANMDISPYRTILKSLMYGDSMETYISETVIRAIECLYVNKTFPEQHESYLQEYIDEEYIHVRDVENMLMNCSAQPLSHFYGDILALF